MAPGLGCRVPPAGRHQHPLLDRDPPARPPAVAGQGAHPDGLAPQPHLLRLLDPSVTLPYLWLFRNPSNYYYYVCLFVCLYFGVLVAEKKDDKFKIAMRWPFTAMRFRLT